MNYEMPDVLPKGWTITSLSEIATHHSGNSKLIKGRLSPKPGKGLYPAFSASGQDVWRSDFEEEGDAIIVSAVGARCGKCFLASEKWSAIANTHVVLAKPEVLDRKFLWYRINDEEFWIRSGSAQPFVVVRKSFARPFALPPLPEQRRIVAELEKQFTRLDAGVTALRRTQTSLKRYSAAILKTACEGRLVRTESDLAQSSDSRHAYESGEILLERILTERRQTWSGRGKYKDPLVPNIATLPKLPDGWTWATIQQLNLSNRPIAYGVLQPGDNIPHGVPFVRVGDIHDGKVDLSNLKRISTDIASQYARTKLQGGELAITLVGTIGRTAIIPKSLAGGNIARAVGIIPLTERANAHWIEIWFRNPAKIAEMDSRSHEVARKTLNLEDVKVASVAIPPIAEQERIVAEVERLLSVVAETEALISANLHRAVRLRQSILQLAFLGRLVPQDSADQLAVTLAPNIPVDSSYPEAFGVATPTEEDRSSTIPLDPTIHKPKRVRDVQARRVLSKQQRELSQMKLLRFKLFDDFNSLKAFDYTLRNPGAETPSPSPICLVGLNGSGKSNLIEALSEVLCTIELGLLPWKAIGSKRRRSAMRFVLEYELKLPKIANPIRVRIVKDDAADRPNFSVLEGDQERTLENEGECLRVLPTRFVGYSSGLNETVSIPYFRTSALYSEEVRNRAKLKAGRSAKSTPVEDSRALFMDYDSNALTLVSNFLFQPRTKLGLFKSALRIADLASFDIRFRPTYQGNKTVLLTHELKNYVACFRKSADEVEASGKGGVEIFKFLNGGPGAKRLRTYFADGPTLFAAGYKLSLLNALALKGRDRRFFLRSDIREGQLERPPSVAREDRIFAVENIRLRLVHPKKIIDYAAISDGEHQFLQIFGSIMLFNEGGAIFLLDEPETHFNPQWRRRFVQDLGAIASTKSQDFVISTHSPFVVSGCHGRQVFKFERKDGYTSGAQVDFETFGASYDFILARLFDLPSMISGQALAEMRGVLKSRSLDRLENSIADFGESFEKRFLFERIAKLKKSKRRRR